MQARYSTNASTRRSIATIGLFLTALALGACQRKTPARAEARVILPPVSSARIDPSKKCVVHLHGRGGSGAPDHVTGDVTHVSPDGNGNAWGGYEWRYFPESDYETVRTIVSNAASTAGCGRLIVHGFSNGAAAAAKLLCRGETFGGRTVGYIIDDPVPDHGTSECKPPTAVKVKLYWTSALSNATDGWSCVSADWLCEGGTTIGIGKYAQTLGVPVTPSVNTAHHVYDSPPEYAGWW